MKTLRLLPLPLLIAVALFVAGCGGGGARSVPANAVAVVGSDTITKTQFNTLLDAAKATYTARKTPFPKVGTSAYKSLSDQAITYLVQESELQQKAKDLGVAVTQKDVDARIQQIKTQYFGGSEKKYQTQLKAQGLSEAQLKQDLFAQLLSEKLFESVTKDVKVGDAEISAYYKKNKTQYVTPKTREVAHILVNSKAQADSLYAQLKGGASFAALAKKYSKDPGSAAKGGQLCVAHGQSTADGKCSQTVTPFDKVAFSLKTGEISQPVHSTYGWHIIKAVGDVTPAHTTPFASVKETIRQSLLSTKKTQTMTSWVDDLKKSYAKKIAYQSGYAPATTSTAATTSTTG